MYVDWQYVTGVFIQSHKVTFDRIAVIRTAPFDFNKDNGPAMLALALYAVTECDVHHAGCSMPSRDRLT